MNERTRNSIRTFLNYFFGIALALSLSSAFFNYVVERNYLVKAHDTCYPETADCFVRECDPEYEECASEDETIAFSLYTIPAHELEICDARTEECARESCSPADTHCTLLSCTDVESEYQCQQ